MQLKKLINATFLLTAACNSTTLVEYPLDAETSADAGAAPTWCEQRKRDPDVAPGDYACADFTGPDLPWAQDVEDGALAITDGALLAKVGQKAGLTWTAAGNPSVIEAVTIRAKVKAGTALPQPGFRSNIISVDFGPETSVGLTYLQAAPTNDAAVFTGLAITGVHTRQDGGGVYALECPVAAELDQETWSDIVLEVSGTGVTLDLRGEKTRCEAGPLLTELGPSGVAISVGLYSNGKPGWNVFIDDVEVAVTR